MAVIGPGIEQKFTKKQIADLAAPLLRKRAAMVAGGADGAKLAELDEALARLGYVGEEEEPRAPKKVEVKPIDAKPEPPRRTTAQSKPKMAATRKIATKE